MSLLPDRLRPAGCATSHTTVAGSLFRPKSVRQRLDSLRSAYRTIDSPRCRQTLLPLICVFISVVYSSTASLLESFLALCFSSTHCPAFHLNNRALSELYSCHRPARQDENDLPGTRSLRPPDRGGVETRGIFSVTCHTKIRGFSTVFRGPKPGEMAWQDLVSSSPGHPTQKGQRWQIVRCRVFTDIIPNRWVPVL